MVEVNLGPAQQKLKIAKVKVPVDWILDSNKNPIGWTVQVDIVGLIPDLYKGYKYEYTLELISPEARIVSMGKLSQASGYMGTSTTAATGGQGLSAGSYRVRIRGENGDEDSVLLRVPDYETYLENQKLHPLESDSSKAEEDENEYENNLKFIKRVILEKKYKVVMLSVVRKDDTKYSVELRNPTSIKYVNDLEIDDETIDIIEYALSVWKSKIDNFAEQYDNDNRMEIEFFDDIVTFAKNLSRLPDKFLDILKFGEATNLMHNRIMSQIIYEYYCLGFNITPLPHKHTGEKIYDFDVISIQNINAR